MTASATFMGNSLGPLAGGFIAAGLGIRWVFALTAALLVANLIWVWVAVRDHHER
jgi:predicted MFS family arabinose efflux permease